MATPKQIKQLIKDAKELRQGIILCDTAQRATLAYLSDVIAFSRSQNDLEMIELAAPYQKKVQENIEVAEHLIPEIDFLIASYSTDIGLSQRVLPLIRPDIDHDATYEIDDITCVSMLREACHAIATTTKTSAEIFLQSGQDSYIAPQFKKQIEKALQYAREAIVLLAL